MSCEVVAVRSHLSSLKLNPTPSDARLSTLWYCHSIKFPKCFQSHSQTSYNSYNSYNSYILYKEATCTRLVRLILPSALSTRFHKDTVPHALLATIPQLLIYEFRCLKLASSDLQWVFTANNSWCRQRGGALCRSKSEHRRILADDKRSP